MKKPARQQSLFGFDDENTPSVTPEKAEEHAPTAEDTSAEESLTPHPSPLTPVLSPSENEQDTLASSSPPLTPDDSSPLAPGPSPLNISASHEERGPEDLTGKTVWVIDGHSLIHQVFHALPEMTSPKGEPVGAVFGFARDMLFLLEEKQPDYLFCAFDLPGKTFRHEMYSEYKIQRPAMDVDLVPQIASVRRVIQTLGIPALALEGFEADDILATVARLTEEQGGECFIITADKDCRQLLTERTHLYNIRKNAFYDAEALQKDWGIAPSQVVDFQALVGDSVDNVPGVPMIGPKFAQQLLEQFGTLDNVLDHASEVAGAKRKENLVTYRDQALLSRELVRLNKHVPIEIDWATSRAGGIDRTAAHALFRDFGFRSIGQKLDAVCKKLSVGGDLFSTPASSTAVTESLNDENEGKSASAASGEFFDESQPSRDVTYHLVNTPEMWETFLAGLQEQKAISFDTETTHVQPRWAELVGLSFCWNENEAWYIPVRCPAGEAALDQEKVLAAIKPTLENPSVEKIGQNLKYDMIVLRSAGVEVKGIAFDTMVASYLLEAGQRNHNLDDLAIHHLGHSTIKISELIGSGKNQKRMDEVPLRKIADYAAEDAWVPWLLRPILEKQLVAMELTSLFHDIELPLIDVLVEMEFNGIAIDVDRLKGMSEEYGRRLERLEQEIHALAGRPFNIASPKQLQEILFTQLKLPVVKKTPKTGPSTDAEVLEELAPLHPLPKKLLEFRQYSKLKSTYIDALPELVLAKTGRVHASFNQVVTATGRLSSSDPNLQNIPVRTEEGREIRSAFVPSPPEWTLLAADYSQIELRILAHFSGDEQLCEAFARDEDIHARVASQVNGVPLEEVSPAMRREAKAVNFGVIYGQSAFGLAKSLSIGQDAAQRFIDGYFAGYPGIEKFLDNVLEVCQKTGYVKTILGRRRAITGVREHFGRQRNLAERTAINTVIQGSAADLMKAAMIAVLRRLRNEAVEARMLLQIHDELIFETPPSQLPKLSSLVVEEMSSVLKLNVPLKIDVKAGPNWADAEKLV